MIGVESLLHLCRFLGRDRIWLSPFFVIRFSHLSPPQPEIEIFCHLLFALLLPRGGREAPGSWNTLEKAEDIGFHQIRGLC